MVTGVYTMEDERRKFPDEMRRRIPDMRLITVRDGDISRMFVLEQCT
jgi:hypothetical protein